MSHYISFYASVAHPRLLTHFYIWPLFHGFDPAPDQFLRMCKINFWIVPACPFLNNFCFVCPVFDPFN